MNDTNEEFLPSLIPIESNEIASAYSIKNATDKTINHKQKSLIKILSNECLENLIEALALCQSSALAMVISNSGYPIELTLEDVQTPGDGLFLLLKSLSKEPLKLIEPLFSYLSKFKRLSEPLLWFCSNLLAQHGETAAVVKSFIERGGLDVISKGLSVTTRQLLYSGPCVVSSLMNFIEAERNNKPPLQSSSSAHAPPPPTQPASSFDNNNDSAATGGAGSTTTTEGFTNFAPFGSIICTSPSGNPVDVLLQNAAPHRRIRSAIWSYHFQPNEHKVGLFLTFPYAFLLKEVQILPHTVSFGNCPAYVSLEVSRDGALMIPVASPVFTMGMSAIKLQLNKSELVNTVQINLFKSKDSHMIGLSQIRLLGYPMFENMLSAKPDMMLTPVEDLVSRSNMGWLRLLYTCMTCAPSLERYVTERVNEATMILCTRLLSSPAMIIYDKIIETILIKLSKHDAKRSLEITKCLLRAELGGSKSGLYSVPHGILMETLVNILFQISETQVSSSSSDPTEETCTSNVEQIERERINIILEWLSECSSLDNSNIRYFPSNMIFHCVACILYKSEHMPNINESFIESLIAYSLSVNEYYTKQSIDWIFCALFYKRPHLIKCLTHAINLNALINQKSSKLNVTESKSLEARQLSLVETLSYAIQSANVLETFMASEFFVKLVEVFIKRVESIFESHQTTNSFSSSIELNLIKVFVSLAEFECGKEWLGSSEMGRNVWQKLLHLLCNTQKSLTISNYEEISLLAIQFVKKMIFCHQENQEKFALFVKKLINDIALDSKFSSIKLASNESGNISSSSASISGFLHQLIIQVLLDDQTILVNFQRKSSLFKASCNSSLGLLTHPRFGTGNNCRLIELPLTKTCAQITQFISDVPLSQILTVNGGGVGVGGGSGGVGQASVSSQQKSNFENVNENVMEMKELLNKFKAFTDYTEPTAAAAALSLSKNAAASSSKFDTVKNLSNKFSLGGGGGAGGANCCIPKLKLFLKESSGEFCIPNDCTLNKILALHLKKIKTRTSHDLTITVHYNFNLDEEFAKNSSWVIRKLIYTIAKKI
jgi:baculoviral IAP repeat-containing protein 6 (apollon)